MKQQKMRVVQCWDDGHQNDIPLCDILRRHGARASFNLNAVNMDQPGKALPLKPDVFDGFTVANHSLTHPRLEQVPIATARADIVDGRKRLQDRFGTPVLGFAYPFGTYTPAAMDLLREAGHVYGRTVTHVEQCFPPQDPMAFHPNCHFLAPDFWTRYERARACGVFYFWGHSYEIRTPEMWAAFEAQIARISADPTAEWVELVDLF